ncbi:MAG TPA: hypothetical protein VK699_17465 [Terriglobales bacterium]|jgi:hypothetical protein|nr:hypothetical protein [Terriglobales bacterium]
MKSFGLKFLYWIVALGICVPAMGQASPQVDQEKGITAIESFQGSINSSNKLLRLDSNLGYDFNKHFGVFTGVPVYYSNVLDNSLASTTGTSVHRTNDGIGNIYLGVTFRLPHDQWNFTSTITGTAPTGSIKKGYSTGRASVDWSNRFGYTFHRITPFVGAGLANTVSDTPLVTRPFTSLGVVGHLEEGAEYDVGHHFSVGASAYQILPSGSQTVFSQVILPDQTSQGNNGKAGQGNNGNGGQGNNGNGQGNNGNNGNGNNGKGNNGNRGNSANAPGHTGNTGQGNPNRPFELASVTTGTGLTRENGFDTWVGFEPSQFWHVEVGYARSITYDFSSITFSLSLDIGRLIRSRRGH